MNSILIDTMVFGKSFERAKIFIDTLIKDIKQDDIYCIHKSKDRYEVRMKNNKSFIAIPASQNCRGYRYNRAYVDMDINKEIIDCVIIPMSCVSNLKVEDRIIYFNHWFNT